MSARDPGEGKAGDAREGSARGDAREGRARGDAGEGERQRAPRARRGARSEAETRARRALGGGGLLLVAGLALVGVGPSDAGMALTVLALLVLVYGIHSFGRLGPERDERAPAPSR
ncbi:hypothetical protein WME76_26990 [Sorangium sp. So ce119]|uniref:hypothetical protein n=1 Tax=Sorangium sp. So ce119 TaxID=3133279 RepID=UPI003F5F3535